MLASLDIPPIVRLLLRVLPPAMGVIALIASLLRHRDSCPNPSRLTRYWVVLYIALLSVAAVSCVTGVVRADTLAVLAFSLVTTLAGMLVSSRDELLDLVDDLPTARRVTWRSTLRVAAFSNAVGMSYLALEIPWNTYGVPTNTTSAQVEVAYVAAILLALWLLGQLHGGLPALGVVFFAFCGFAQHLVLTFNNSPVTPSDVLALRTAAAVSGGYVYTVTSRPLLGIMCAAVGIAGLAFVRPMRRDEDDEPEDRLHAALWLAPRVLCGIAGVACAVGLAVALARVNLLSTFDIAMDYWPSTIMQTYSEQGLAPTFVSAAQGMRIHRPAGYTPSTASELEQQLSDAYEATADRTAAMRQYTDEQPSIVVVMNETFSDLSTLDGLHAGYAGPTFFRTGFPDALCQGRLYVSVKGGGTCNTEFEFLTGNQFAFVGVGKSPYAMYDFTNVDNLARQLGEEGYRTTAIHPNLPTNWNRESVYEQMGFDRFVTIQDFADAPTFHNGVTDAATYDKIIELLESSTTPQFIFDVTMQNHSSYDKGDIPASRLTHVVPTDIDDSEYNAELNEYLSCIQASDADLKAFVERLSSLDRPVILVFFGDHQPYFTNYYNDEFFSEDEDPIEHQSRVYQTAYVMWANYDVAGSAQDGAVLDTSTGYLSSMLLEAAGAPLTRYQQAKLQLQKSLPAVYAYGYLTPDGTWHALSESDEARDDLARIQYLEFATKVD